MHRLATGPPEGMKDLHVPADTEVLDTHLEVTLGLAGFRDFDARVEALLQSSFDGQLLCLEDVGVGPLSCPADAHGVVGGTELDHVDAGNGKDGVDVFDAFAFFDHEGYDGVIESFNITGVARFADGADIAPHADTEKAPAATGVQRFGTDGSDAGPGVFDRADIGEEDGLEARADRPHGLVGPLGLFDFDHACQACEFECATYVVEVVHSERAVFGSELDIVIVASLAYKFDESGPGGKGVSAEGGLVGVEALAESIRAHLQSPRSFLAAEGR